MALFTEINAYLEKLHGADEYTKLATIDRQKAVFTATELLGDYFPVDKLTPRSIALQVLYTLEGEAEEYGKLKRQGITKFATKGISVEFSGSGISPEVIQMLKPSSSKARVGRLI
ncbi:hypothetical protein [Paenibacillus sp.]